MKKWYRHIMTGLLLALPFLLMAPELEARGSRGGWGGSRSSSWGSRRSTPSRSSSWKKSPSKTSGWGKSSTSSTKKKGTSGWGKSSAASTSKSSSKFKPAPKNSPSYKRWSAADKKLAAKAKASGTSYKSRSAATDAFKKKNASKYSSKYASKPSTRPSHIPQTYKSSGTTYNITYNPSHGGYGYYGPSGRWMFYDAMADAAMMSMLMQRSNYYYPGIHPAPVVAHDPGWSVGAVVGTIVLGMFVLLAVGIVLSAAFTD